MARNGGNSKMNNESLIGKSDEKGKYYKSSLSVKQLNMYGITNWGKKQILNHYYDVLELLERKESILKV